MDFSEAKTYAVIVAGGSGSRIGGSLPKQFLEVLGKPIIVYTIEAFLAAVPDIEIIVAVNTAFKDHWEKLQAVHFSNRLIKTVSGGKQRFHSVKQALDTLPRNDHALVAVHDSVRPLISTDLVQTCFHHAANGKAVIPVVPLRASIRKKDGENTIAQRRADFVTVQTPQVFPLIKLQEAYQQNFQNSFTDDASVYEHAGNTVSTIEGDVTNIKVTYQEDLKILEALLSRS